MLLHRIDHVIGRELLQMREGGVLGVVHRPQRDHQVVLGHRALHHPQKVQQPLALAARQAGHTIGQIVIGGADRGAAHGQVAVDQRAVGMPLGEQARGLGQPGRAVLQPQLDAPPQVGIEPLDLAAARGEPGQRHLGQRQLLPCQRAGAGPQGGLGPDLQACDHPALTVDLDVDLLAVGRHLLVQGHRVPARDRALVEPGQALAEAGVVVLQDVQPLLGQLARVGALAHQHHRLAVHDQGHRVLAAGAAHEGQEGIVGQRDQRRAQHQALHAERHQVEEGALLRQCRPEAGAAVPGGDGRADGAAQRVEVGPGAALLHVGQDRFDARVAQRLPGELRHPHLHQRIGGELAHGLALLGRHVVHVQPPARLLDDPARHPIRERARGLGCQPRIAQDRCRLSKGIRAAVLQMPVQCRGVARAQPGHGLLQRGRRGGRQVVGDPRPAGGDRSARLRRGLGSGFELAQHPAPQAVVGGNQRIGQAVEIGLAGRQRTREAHLLLRRQIGQRVEIEPAQRRALRPGDAGQHPLGGLPDPRFAGPARRGVVLVGLDQKPVEGRHVQPDRFLAQGLGEGHARGARAELPAVEHRHHFQRLDRAHPRQMGPKRFRHLRDPRPRPRERGGVFVRAHVRRHQPAAPAEPG